MKLNKQIINKKKSMNETRLILIERDELKKLIQEAVRDSQPPQTSSPQKTEEHLLTSDELAAELHMSKVTIWKLRKAGRIIGYKLGRRVYYKKSEILNGI